MAAMFARSARAGVFESVFPAADYTTPTPEATPDLGTTSPGRPFGGFNIPADAVNEAIQAARAWSAATRYLTLSAGTGTSRLQHHELSAFEYLLGPGGKTDALVDWYMHEIESHYRETTVTNLRAWHQPIPISQALKVLGHTIQILQSAQQHYFERPQTLPQSTRDPRKNSDFLRVVRLLEQKWHALVLHSLPKQRLQKTLASAFYQQMQSSLMIKSNTENCLEQGSCRCRISLDGLPLAALHQIGLGGDLGERALALAVHRFLDGPAVERRCFQVDWSGQEAVIPRLRVWMHDVFTPAIQHAIGELTDNAAFTFSSNDVSRMISTAVSNLGRKRTAAMFDYVKSFPASTGALLDLKEYLSTGGSNEKAYICSSFSAQTRNRLLHAGASTTEILSIYVNVIYSFRILDARGVLLEKVALPIRSYLRTRDDTVGVIAESFLADVDENGHLVNDDDGRVCAAIASEVEGSLTEQPKDDHTLNWDDMEWVPDPIDAGPNHKLTKNEDILTYVLGLFDQEDFIKEVTSVLAQNLLQASDPEFAKETRLVELLKTRFDPSKLQAVEVMLKDVRDSVHMQKRMFGKSSSTSPPTPQEIQAAIPSEGITTAALWPLFEGRMNRAQFLASVKLVTNRRGDLYFPKRGRLPPQPPDASKPSTDGDFSFRILSSFFWPQLRNNKFNTLPGYEEAHYKTSEMFTELSGQRKLDFRPALGRVSLTLDLEDRSITENDTPAWRAVLIDAFASERGKTKWQQDEDGTYDDSTGWTAEQLQEHLQMDAELVLDAISFWSGKRVLYQRSPGTYAVLERLDLDVSDSMDAQGVAEDAAFSALKSQDSMLRDNAPMFEAFIGNMLRNSGPKEIGGMMGITGMLKMVLPLFTYGEDETRWLLGQMEGRGEVVRDGEQWAVAK